MKMRFIELLYVYTFYENLKLVFQKIAYIQANMDFVLRAIETQHAAITHVVHSHAHDTLSDVYRIRIQYK